MSVTPLSPSTAKVVVPYHRTAMSRFREANAISSHKTNHKRLTTYVRKIPVALQQGNSSPFLLATMLRASTGSLDIFA